MVGVAEEVEATREEALWKIGDVKAEGDARQRVSNQQFGEEDAHPSRRNAACTRDRGYNKERTVE